MSREARDEAGGQGESVTTKPQQQQKRNKPTNTHPRRLQFYWKLATKIDTILLVLGLKCSILDMVADAPAAAAAAPSLLFYFFIQLSYFHSLCRYSIFTPLYYYCAFLINRNLHMLWAQHTTHWYTQEVKKYSEKHTST